MVGEAYNSFDLNIFAERYDNRSGGILPIGEVGHHRAVFVKATLTGGKYPNGWIEDGTLFRLEPGHAASQNSVLKPSSRLHGGRASFGRLLMLVGYARVSTDVQTTDGQIDVLHAAGCERVFEESMSGTRTDCPQLAAALEFAREGDVLVVARLDRLARSMRQLLSTVDALQARGIGLRSLHENIDTTSATGRLILHIFAALGQFEVELLRERTRTALAASRARGRVGGRPPALDAIKVTAARAMLASGTMTASEVARQVGCSASTLYRHVPGGRTAVIESATSATAARSG